MKERPILFKDEMVRAILEGRKTQTRRIVKPQPETMRDPFPTTPETMMADGYSCNRVFKITESPGVYRCLGMRNFVEAFSPYGQPGDRLWVRETWGVGSRPDPFEGSVEGIEYRADDFGLDEVELLPLHRVITPEDVYLCDYRSGWKPSIHMPRWASRITLEITGVRVERLHACNEVDAIAEGAPWAACGSPQEGSHKAGFAKLWESINGPGSWEANPWVWVIEFKRVQP